MRDGEGGSGAEGGGGAETRGESVFMLSFGRQWGGERGREGEKRTKPYFVQAPQKEMPRWFWIVGRRVWECTLWGVRG